MVLLRPTRPFRTDTQKWCPFHYRGLERKSRKSRDTWNNRQIWPWSTEWIRAKANRVWPREHVANTLFQQLKRRLYSWTSSDGEYQNLIIFFAAKDGEALYGQKKTRLGADCGSDHELLIAKFKLKLKKAGKTTIRVQSKSNPLWLYSRSDK